MKLKQYRFANAGQGLRRCSRLRPASGTTPRQAGQAVIELAVAIVLLLIVVTGILHVSRLARTSLFLQSVLRNEAGTRAMDTGAMSDSASYISDWEEGEDGLRYTSDDQPVLNSGGLSSTMMSLLDKSVNSGDDWQHVTDETRLSSSMIQVHNTPMLESLVEMTHEKERLYVPVDSVIRELVYDKDEIPIEEEVWMPLMGGLL